MNVHSKGNFFFVCCLFIFDTYSHTHTHSASRSRAREKAREMHWECNFFPCVIQNVWLRLFALHIVVWIVWFMTTNLDCIHICIEWRAHNSACQREISVWNWIPLRSLARSIVCHSIDQITSLWRSTGVYACLLQFMDFGVVTLSIFCTVNGPRLWNNTVPYKFIVCFKTKCIHATARSYAH